MSPVEWCERMEHSAKDGNEAYVYFQLKEMWKKREKSEQVTPQDNAKLDALIDSF